MRRRRRHGALVAHLGLVVVAVGIAASSTYTSVTEQRLAPVEEVVVSGVSARREDLTRERIPQAMTTAAHVTIDDGGPGTSVTARLSFYPSHGMTVGIPGVRSSVTRDVYVTLLEVDEDATAATVRVAVNPLVGWAWARGVLMIAGAARRLAHAAAANPAVVPGRTRGGPRRGARAAVQHFLDLAPEHPAAAEVRRLDAGA